MTAWFVNGLIISWLISDEEKPGMKLTVLLGSDGLQRAEFTQPSRNGCDFGILWKSDGIEQFSQCYAYIYTFFKRQMLKHAQTCSNMDCILTI